MSSGKIIFLNGVSSSGKSSLAMALQQRLEEPFLHFQLDAFIEMLPWLGDDALFMEMVSGMHCAMAAMSNDGLNLIVDHVLIEKEWLDQCLDLLADRYVLFMGLNCDLEELERRERQRDNRRQGFARAQLPKIHKDKVYDLELYTCRMNVQACADRILEFYRSHQPTAFNTMRHAS